MRKLLPVIAACLLFASNTQAAGLDLSLSNESANVEILSALNLRCNGQRSGGSRLPGCGQLESTGALTLGIFYNELNDVVTHAKLVAVGAQTNTRLPYQLEFGAKAYIGEVKQEETDVGAVAIGGGIKIQKPSRYNPVDLRVGIFFTPGITTFGDTDSLTEITARLSLEIVPAAHAYVGYRRLEIKTDSHATLDLDDNVHFGFRLQF